MSLINTKTNIFTSNGHIGIYTFYQKCLNYINFWINGSPEKTDGVNFIEGQLGYKIDGYNDKFFLNNKGELIVSADDTDKYAIDSNGNLTTTKDFCGDLIPNLIIKYGYLYNWYAVNNASPICAANAHVPTIEEVNSLPDFAGLITGTSEMLCVPGTEFWGYNGGGTNTTGFSARGSGWFYNSVFSDINSRAYFWTTSYNDGANGYFFAINGKMWGDADTFSFSSNALPKVNGLSVRLVIDAPIEISGSHAIYVGNDGRRYNCVLINSVWWLAENLAETKYRDDSLIPNVTERIAWEDLTTGAMCAYDNDNNNVFI